VQQSAAPSRASQIRATVDRVKVTVQNLGAELVSTSYWSTPHAQQGLLYVTINAATLRVLVPAATRALLAELPAVGTTCDLTSATLEGHETYQLTWRDDPDDPDIVEIDQAQCDRPIPAADAGRVLPLIWEGQQAGRAGVTITAARASRRN